MFKKPIQPVPLRTIEEVKANSIRIGKTSVKPLSGFIGEIITSPIIYADESGILYITPYRYDIDKVLHNFLDSIKHTNFPQLTFYSEYMSSDRYKWLEKIADEENWAYTYESAFQFAQGQGIEPIVIGETITLKQIISKPLKNYLGNTVEICHPLVNQFLTSGTSQNVSTYIHLSSKSLLVCDEYGRTFYIAVSGVVNDIENQLINSGYTRTMHPEQYVIYSSKDETSPSNNHQSSSSDEVTTAPTESIPNYYPF